MFDFLPNDDRSRFVLDAEGVPEPCEDRALWGKWAEDTDRRIAHSKIGSFEIVTLFVGIDLRDEGDEGDPILWVTETKIPLEIPCDRYRSRADAMAGHEAACEAACKALNVTSVREVDLNEEKGNSK